MSGHLKVVIVLLIVGTLSIVAYRYIWPQIQDELQLATSDASDTNTTVRIGMDNWVGYFPLCSPEMSRRLRREGIKLKCIDDKADYEGRFDQLDRKELDMAVATVDSWLLNGKSKNFPGVIVGVLDESKGGDAIVARDSHITSLDDIRHKKDIRIAFTPASPSEHLLKSISTHFDIPELRNKRGKWRIEADGSSVALDMLLDKKVDVAVLWEPDVSRALSKPGIKEIISTKDTDKLIVDILIAGRHYLSKHEDIVEKILKTYFDTLRYYNLNPERLTADIKEATKLNEKQVEAMLDGVEWTGLSSNAIEWFGLTGKGLYGDEALIDAIYASLDVLMDNRDFDHNPLPDEDPYRITYRDLVDKLYKQRNFSGQNNKNKKSHSNARKFSVLSNEAWSHLKEIGTLRVDPVSFRRGSGLLDLDGKQVLDQVAERLKRYPNFRILVKGHSGLRGDRKANLDLSADRAAAVARYLLVTYQLDENGIHSVGYGGSRPLPRLDGESNRAYSYRLPRVEIALVTEDY